MKYWLTGLTNLGNTCYMNSSLQALFATEEFRNYVMFEKSEGPLFCEVSKLFKAMASSETENKLSPIDLRSKFVSLKPQFDGKDQHDAQEFLRFIIDLMHEEMNKATKTNDQKSDPKSAKESWNTYTKFVANSFLVSLFVGQIKSIVKCMRCSHESYCWDSFWDISLSLEEDDNNSDIISCLKLFTAEEKLENDAMPTCSQCLKKTISTKRLQFIRSPLILIIQLKKFANNGQKIAKQVFVNEHILINWTPYRLYACMCHSGTNSSNGHYTVFCRYQSNNWYFFDDLEEKVQLLQNTSSNDFKDAYILFYHMKGVTIRSIRS